MSQLVDKFKLEKSVADEVIAGIASRAYSLLLGAGASYDAIGGDGQPIKGATDLAEELNQILKLGLESPDSGNLALVYGDALQPPHVTKLIQFLKKRFTSCRPDWQTVLHQFNWKRIWTLNIDDIVERSRPATSAKRLDVYNWTDEFKPRDRGERELQVIHLHGIADRITDNSAALIFSLKEYATRNEQLPGWHAEFRSEFSQKPFIVCGARLQDEYDLISVLEYGNRSATRGGAPSLAVIKSFSAGQEARLQRFGLIPIAATGKAFFEALAQDVNEYMRASRFMSPEVVTGRNELRSAFRQLTSSSPVVRANRRSLDFYSSAEATWEHICQDLDANLSISNVATGWISEPTRDDARIALITGGPVSGKSATILRIGKNLLERGQEVWLFRGEQLFDEASVIEYLKTKGSAVLLIDDCADFSGAIRRLISEAKSKKAHIRMIATTENSRRRAVRSDIEGAHVRELLQEPLSKEDFLQIFEKRLQKARLGSSTGIASNDAWRQFKDTYRYRLLEWLESLENANEYREALRRILSSSSEGSSVAKNLVAATSTVQRFGYSLPFFVTASLCGNQTIESIVDEGGALFDVAYIDQRGLRLRNSAFATFAWSCLSARERFDWALNIARRVAPLVVPLSVSNRTVPYLIIRNLMDAENVRRDQGSLAESWYANLESDYGWNARFWEQRALLASEEERDPMAYSYARRAVSLHGRDPFAHTTLGKVCLKMAVSRNDEVSADRFWEGVASLDRSRTIAHADGQEWEHPYVTFFTYALKAVGLRSFKDELPKLTSAWNDWIRAAQASSVFSDGERSSNPRLEEFQRQWLQQAVRNRQ